MYFGVPGCGKTTSAVREIIKHQYPIPFWFKFLYYITYPFIKLFNKSYGNIKEIYNYYFGCSTVNYYSNFPNTVSKLVSLEGLGTWTFPANSMITIDESAIEYNSRNFKSFPQYTIKWFKLHRHYLEAGNHKNCSTICFWSQGWNDTDKIIRDLCDEVWYVKKLGPFTMLRRIYKKIEIDEHTHQIIDGYKFEKILVSLMMKIFGFSSLKIYLRKPYYKYFDSWIAPKLPIKYGVDKNETKI